MPDDLKLTPDGDLDLAAGGAAIVRGIDAVMQQLRIRLRLARGEWFLDTRLGVPYREMVFSKSPDMQAISTMFRQVIQVTDGVNRLLSYTQSLHGATRVLTVTVSVDTVYGPLTLTESI